MHQREALSVAERAGLSIRLNAPNAQPTETISTAADDVGLAKYLEANGTVSLEVLWRMVHELAIVTSYIISWARGFLRLRSLPLLFSTLRRIFYLAFVFVFRILWRRHFLTKLWAFVGFILFIVCTMYHVPFQSLNPIGQRRWHAWIWPLDDHVLEDAPIFHPLAKKKTVVKLKTTTATTTI